MHKYYIVVCTIILYNASPGQLHRNQMNQSPFNPRRITKSISDNADLDEDTSQIMDLDEYCGQKQTNTNNSIEDNYEGYNKIMNQFDSISQKPYDEQCQENKLELSYKSKETEEYQRQLFNLEQKIVILRSELHEQTIKNSELEKKLKDIETLSHNVENNSENIRKISQLEVLLKESRKQNLTYSDEIKLLRKKEFNFDKVNDEINYLKHENMTLKGFIVAQNKMTHYRHAFDNLKIENYCTKCSESIREEYMKRSDSNQLVGLDDNEKDIQDPTVNKTGHRNTATVLKNSSQRTIQWTNSRDSTESMDTKLSKFNKETLPNINKMILRQLGDRIDVPLDSLDFLARTVIHMGDQVLVRVAWDIDKQIRATIKYIGNLDERYQYRLFVGVKLCVKTSEIPENFQNSGWFRNKRYFSINSNNGYFLHFTNVIAIYIKETAEFLDFGDYLHRNIDPKANSTIRMNNNSIKELIAK